ncbi:MAG: DUF4926 domain-containing protein [Verrucomicrobia bacterium]|nr:DUF4926 domain-containing protein [Verrucomicrobiota bacterium]
MNAAVKLFDVVALERALPEKGLERGQVGTVVEKLSDGHFEVEFSDDAGRAYAFAALAPQDLLKLRYEPGRTDGAPA